MKVSLILLLLIQLTGCFQPEKTRSGMTFATPSAYNNYIIERQKWVANYITSFYGVLNDDADSASVMLKKGLTRIDELLGEIKELPPYKGDTVFRQAAINSFGFYRRLFTVDYPAVLNLHTSKEGIGITELREQNEIFNQIVKDEDKYDKQLHNRQRDFAEKNHMILTSDEKEKTQ